MFGRKPLACTHASVPCRGVFERAHDARADGDDATATRTRSADGEGGRLRNVVRLVEGKEAVEFFVAGRRDAGGVRQSLELDSAFAHRRERAPVEREARGRRLERDRRARDPRPNVPERERRVDVRVLNRTTVARKSRPDLVRRGVEQ